MLRKSVIVFTLFCVLGLINGDREGNIPPQSSASPPTTTTSNSTSSSEAPTTSSTSTPSTSTTVTPTTSQTTTTPAPSSVPYIVRDGNITCILARLNIEYVVKNQEQNRSINIILPNNMSTEGSTCHGPNDTQLLYLKYTSDNESTINTTLTFTFEKNNNTHSFALGYISFFGVKEEQAGNTTFDYYSNSSEFATPLTKSYHCDKVQEILLKDKLSTSNMSVILKISNVQFQAFHEADNGNFGAAEDCAASTSPDVVPIAVGCALVGLIAVVLIAYLVGRRRSTARGYLSM